MKAIHLTAYGNTAQSLMMVEVSEPNAPSANEARSRSRDGDCTALVVIYAGIGCLHQASSATPRLFEDADLTIEQVARRCGFGEPDTMRRAFLRR